MGRHNECREGCLDLLTEPRIPRWTRIQTLQMVSTLLQPAAAQDCLHKVGTILSEMDADKWQTRLLKSDNNKMLADLNVWRNKNGHGEDLDGTEWGDIGGEPVAEFFQFDRHMEYKANDEMELDEEARTSELAVRTQQLELEEKTGPLAGAQLPSPTGSDEL